MKETEVQLQLSTDSPPGPPGLQEDSGGEREPHSLGTEGLQHPGHHGHQGEVEEPLDLLARVALTPPSGDESSCSFMAAMEMTLQAYETQLEFEFLMSRADDLRSYLVSGLSVAEKVALAAAVPSLLHSCQSYFIKLESTARAIPQQSQMPFDIYPMQRLQLLDLSQQLCDRLEQLVLNYATYELLSLDEREPNSMSHFCIGRSQLGQMRITTFRYWKPTPYLAQVDTGLYKRIRWNVERLRDRQWTDEEQGREAEESDAETVGETKYYFLCCEDIPNMHAEAERDSQSGAHSNMMRKWSIGLWVQENPDPDTEDIYDWILCEVPQANYHRLLCLGSDEPSSCSATNCLEHLLVSHQME